MSDSAKTLADKITKLINKTKLDSFIRTALPIAKMQEIAANIDESIDLVENLPTSIKKAVNTGRGVAQEAAKLLGAKDIDDDVAEVYKRLIVLASQTERSLGSLASKHHISETALRLALKNTSNVVVDFIVDNSVTISKTITKAAADYGITIDTTVTGQNKLSKLLEKTGSDLVSDKNDVRIAINQSIASVRDDIAEGIYDDADKRLGIKKRTPVGARKTTVKKTSAHKRVTARAKSHTRKALISKRTRVRAPDALDLKRLINASLANTICYDFMQPSDAASSRAYLRCQTKRFANSVRVSSVRNTVPGEAITLRYNNAGFPYNELYHEGGKWATNWFTKRGRDIEHIATGAIRKLATEALAVKFAGIRIIVKENA